MLLSWPLLTVGLLAFLPQKSLTDIYYLTQRFTHDRKETRRIISALLVTFELLDTAAIDCHKAFFSDTGDYEDGVMIETALRSGMDCIVTRNLQDYQQSPIPVYSPAEFLRQLT